MKVFYPEMERSEALSQLVWGELFAQRVEDRLRRAGLSFDIFCVEQPVSRNDIIRFFQGWELFVQNEQEKKRYFFIQKYLSK